jgi:hypothetical protein
VSGRTDAVSGKDSEGPGDVRFVWVSEFSISKRGGIKVFTDQNWILRASKEASQVNSRRTMIPTTVQLPKQFKKPTECCSSCPTHMKRRGKTMRISNHSPANAWGCSWVLFAEQVATVFTQILIHRH